jgi:hypothetical protein
MRTRDRGDHAPRHGLRLHPQFRVHTADHHVDAREQFLRTVHGSVFEDVALDSGKDAERFHLLVQLGDDVELFSQPVGGQAVRDRQPRRVIGQREVFVAERARFFGHRANRIAAVRPVGVHVEITFELCT